MNKQTNIYIYIYLRVCLCVCQHLMARDGCHLLQLLGGGGVLFACGRRDMLPPIKAALQAAADRDRRPFEPFFKGLIAAKQWRTEVY